MPYPNEHACRIRSPGDFQSDSFRRIEGGEGADKLSIIIGRLTGKTTTTTQAFRYPKDTWTEARAKAHCAEQEGTFEAAAPSKESFVDLEVSHDTISLKDRLRAAIDADDLVEAATFKTKIQELRTLLHKTWGDLSDTTSSPEGGEGGKATAAASETIGDPSESSGEFVEVGTLIAQGPPLPDPDPKAVYNLFKKN